MAITKLTTVLDKVSTLANIITGQASTVKTAFDYDVNVVKDYINNTLTTEIDTNFETKDNLTINRKLSTTGNFTGTWNGYTPVQTDPGIQAIVNEHTSQLAETVKQVNGVLPDENGSVTIDISEIDTSQLATKEELNTVVASISGGFPKGVYNTLALLQSAFPTGATGIHFVLENGNWYYWNGLGAWVSGGTFGYPVSVNLFNASTATDGYYVNAADGNLVSDAGYFASAYIPATASTNYATNIASFTCFYNVSKVFISGIISSATGYFTTPANTAFIRFSNPDKVGAKLVKGDSTTQGTSVTLTYEEPTPTIHTLIVKANGTIGTNCNFTSLKLALDSITDNNKTNRYVIKVLNGTYEVNGLGVASLGIKAYVDIIGQSKTGVIIKHTAATMDDTKNTFDVAFYGGFNGECFIKNVTLISYNCKATFHADSAVTDFKGTITIENCILINNNKYSGSSNHNCVALGLRPEQNIVVKNCLANGFIWAHNSTVDGDLGASFIVENCTCEYLWVATLGSKTKDVCKFINNKCEYIKLVYADHLNRINTDNMMMAWDIELEGNDFNYMMTAFDNIGNVSLGDFWNILYNNVYAITDNSIHDYCYNGTGATIVKGTYVDMTDRIAKTITTATIQANAYGVVLRDIPSGSHGVVQYKGNFAKALSNGV